MTMRSLAFLLIVSFVLVLMAGEANAGTEPVAHWSFDEGEGNIAHDESENGNKGNLENGPMWVAGISYSALDFDGEDDYIEVRDDDSLNLGTDEFTISVWIKPEQLDGRQIIKKGSSTNNALEIQIEYSNGYHHIHGTAGCGGSPCNVVDSEEIYTDVWYHIIFLRTSNNQLMLYLDSKLHDQKNYTNSNLNNSENFFIGYDPNYADEEFDGIIDHITIWNRALSSDEISELYNTSRGPVAHWSFDEDEGNIAHDESGNGNDGTLENGPVWVDGISGGALQFDGDDDYVRIGDSELYRGGSNLVLSLGLWFNIEGFNDGYDFVYLITKFANSNSKDWGLLVENGTSSNTGNRFYFYSETTGEDYQCSYDEFDLTLGHWYHGAFVANDNTLSLYLDGNLVKSCDDISGHSASTSAPIEIAHDGYDPYRWSNISVDDLVIWNRALSPEEILSLYKRESNCQNGDTKIAEDGCNQCICNNEEWSCTEVYCSPDDTTKADDDDSSAISIPSVSLVSSITAIGIIALRRRY